MKLPAARRWTGIALLSLMVTLSPWIHTAHAQEQEQSLPPTQEAKTMLAHRLFAISRGILKRSGGELSAERQALVMTLSDMSLSLEPSNLQLWQFRREMAQIIGDPDALKAALQQIIKLDPKNDVAQLELIQLTISQLPTLDAQLRRIEQLLRSTTASRLSDALRSRLASQAASLAREINDEAKFGRWLTDAIRLDPANPEAASMLYQLALEKDADPARRGAALVNLIRADPLNAQARMTLSMLLAQHGAYDDANDQFEVSIALMNPDPLPIEAYRLWAHALGASARTAEGLALIDQLRSFYQVVPDPETGQEPEPFDDVQLLLVEAMLADPGTPAYIRAVKELSLVLSSHENLFDDLTRIAAVIGADLLIDLDETTQQAIEASDIFQGYEAMRSGDVTAARDMLGPMAADDPLASLALAQMETDESISESALQSVVSRNPSTLAGMLASQELIKMNQEPTASAQGRALVRAMNRMPTQLWRMDIAQQPWLDIRLELPIGPYKRFEPIVGKLTLRNVSALRVALNGLTPIADKAVVEIIVSRAGKTIAKPEPDVVSFAHRLALDPQETLTIPVRLDQGNLSPLLEADRFGALSMTVTVLADPRAAASGQVIMGPLGDSDTARGRMLAPTTLSSEQLEAWIAQLGNQANVASLTSAAMLMGILDPLTGPPLSDEQRIPLEEAITNFASEAGELALAWSVSLNKESSLGDRLRRIFEQAKRSDSELVRFTYLAMQVRDPQAPELLAALRSDNEEIRIFAGQLQTVIEETLALREQAQP